VLQNIAVEPGIHSLAWRHQFGIFWIPHGIATLTPKLETRWSWVANLMLRQFYPMTNSPRFSMNGMPVGNLEKKIPLHLPGLETRFIHSVDLPPYRYPVSDSMSVAYPSTHNVQNIILQDPSYSYSSIWQLYGARGGAIGRNWLRHCATRQKVVGSVPDGVTGIFHWHNPSGRTMALRLIQSLTEISTRNISWGVKAAGA
jgi:hypothetical protein